MSINQQQIYTNNGIFTAQKTGLYYFSEVGSWTFNAPMDGVYYVTAINPGQGGSGGESG